MLKSAARRKLGWEALKQAHLYGKGTARIKNDKLRKMLIAGIATSLVDKVIRVA